MQPFISLHPPTTRPILTPKLEQRSFCSAQNPASFGVKLAYGVKLLEIAVNKKPETSRFIKKFQALSVLNWKFTAQSASSWGTGQGRLTNGFIFLYKPIHAASFFLLPYVTLRNSPQLTGNLV